MYVPPQIMRQDTRTDIGTLQQRLDLSGSAAGQEHHRRALQDPLRFLHGAIGHRGGRKACALRNGGMGVLGKEAACRRRATWR